MAEHVDDLSVNYEEDGLLVVKELDKAVLTKGAWATLLFRYTQWDAKAEAYGPDRYVIRRYRKLQGAYKPQSKFTISSRNQAQQIVGILNGWLEQPEGVSADEAAGED